MRTLNFVSVFLIIFILLSCKNNKNTETYEIIKETFNNGKVKSRLVIINEKVSKKISIDYYPNGKIKDSVVFVDGKMNGLRYHYDTSNNFYTLQEYKNGKLNGLDKAVYNDGNIKYIGERRKGKQVNEWKFYYKNGLISSYECFNLHSERYYLRSYDTLGNIKKSMGTILAYITMNEQYAKVNEDFNYKLRVAKPPNSKISLKLGELNRDSDVTSLKSIGIDSSIVELSEEFERKGKHKKILYWRVKDTVNEVVHNGKDVFIIPAK